MMSLAFFLLGALAGIFAWLYIVRFIPNLQQEIYQNYIELYPENSPIFHSEKAAIIVMDGMSEFDWTILKRSFTGICYCQSAAFAMIPSTTSISRQCLLSGKYPSQLIEPWKQSKEKNAQENMAIRTIK